MFAVDSSLSIENLIGFVEKKVILLNVFNSQKSEKENIMTTNSTSETTVVVADSAVSAVAAAPAVVDPVAHLNSLFETAIQSYSREDVLAGLHRVAVGGRPDRDSVNAQALRRWFAESGIKRNEAAHFVAAQEKAAKKAAKAAKAAKAVPVAAPVEAAAVIPPPPVTAQQPTAQQPAAQQQVVSTPTQEVETRGRRAEVPAEIIQQLKAAGFALQGERDAYGLILKDKFAVAHAPILINHRNHDPHQRGLKVAYIVVSGYVAKDGVLHLNYNAVVGGVFTMKDDPQGYYNYNHVVDTTFDNFNEAVALLQEVTPVLANHKKF